MSFSADLGSDLQITSTTIKLGLGGFTQGAGSIHIGCMDHDTTACGTDVISVLNASSVINSSTVADSIAIGNVCTLAATANCVAIGPGANASTSANNSFVLGNGLQLHLYSPVQGMRTISSHTASANFVTLAAKATAFANGIVVFNISSAATVTMPAAADCLALMPNYVVGSYITSYLSNIGTATLTVTLPAGTVRYGPATIPSKRGRWLIIKANASAGIDYIF